MLLYKFVTTQRAITILESSTIRFTQLAALNDPFESHPQIEGFVTKDAVFHIFDSVMSDEYLLSNLTEEIYKRMYQDLPPEERELHDFQSYRLYLKGIVDAKQASSGTTFGGLIRPRLELNSDSILKNIIQNIITSITNKICVLSLSNAISNPAMWSYYADSHRGVAIGFDAQDPFFSKALQVQYQKERPQVHLFPIPEGGKKNSN